MKVTEFLKKITSGYLWANLLAMAAAVVLLFLGVRFGLDLYTHHGEAIPVPNVRHKAYDDARRILKNAGLKIEVSDTGYIKTLPPDCILEQSVEPGQKVKGGRIIYVTVNASKTPTLTIPDVIDNSSLREAMAKLTAMGFRLGEPQFVPGEQDWVYGIVVKGRHVVAGDKVSVEDVLTIQVGNGQMDFSDSLNYIDPVYEEVPDEDIFEEAEEEDNFEVVEVPAEAASPAEQAGSAPAEGQQKPAAATQKSAAATQKSATTTQQKSASQQEFPSHVVTGKTTPGHE